MSATNETPGTGPHVGDLAQLHALGALEPHERAQVEAHVANCMRCARELGQAELMVSALDDAFVPQLEPPERLAVRIATSGMLRVPGGRRAAASTAWRARSFYAAAAALLLAAGIDGGAFLERSRDARQAAQDSAVLATIATSHFNHVSFTARDPAAPVSKVLYARDGAWLYIVIDSAACSCRVIARTTAGQRDLGRPTARGTTATLFVRADSRASSVALVGASGVIVSDAQLVYAAQ